MGAEIGNMISTTSGKAAISQGVAIGANIGQGFAQYGVSRRQAAMMENQAAIAEYDAKVQASQTREQGRKFAANQKMRFAKSGVQFAGTPLDVVDETITKTQQEIDFIMNRGRLQGDLYRQQAASTRSGGRAAILGGFVKGLAGAFMNRSSAAAWAGPQAATPKGVADPLTTPLTADGFENIPFLKPLPNLGNF